MQFKHLAINFQVKEGCARLTSLPNEVLGHLLAFCDINSLFKTRLTSTKLSTCSSRPLAERFQIDWRVCFDSKMTPMELLRHHPLKFFANLKVHVSRSPFALSWLKRHHLSPSIIPSLLRLYPEGDMSLPSNIIVNSKDVFGVLDNGEFIAWFLDNLLKGPTVFPCPKNRTRQIQMLSEGPMNTLFSTQSFERHIHGDSNSGYPTLGKVDAKNLQLMTMGNSDEKVTERLLGKRIQSVCILKSKTYLGLLETGDVVGWGEGIDEFQDIKIPDKAVSITPNFSSKSCSIVLADGRTIFQTGYLFHGDEHPSTLSMQFRDRIKHIYSTEHTHITWQLNGNITIWGDLYGGEVPIVPKNTDIHSIHQTSGAFALLLEDGRVMTFGDPKRGGRLPALLKNRTVKALFSTYTTFIALLENRTILSWNDESVDADLPMQLIGCRVKTIFSNQCGFMAILEDGSLYCWGRITENRARKVMIPKERHVKCVIPSKLGFVVQLDNNRLILIKVGCERYHPRFVFIQHDLPMPEGRCLAVMDKGL